jgi:hypothetical protein
VQPREHGEEMTHLSVIYRYIPIYTDIYRYLGRHQSMVKEPEMTHLSVIYRYIPIYTDIYRYLGRHQSMVKEPEMTHQNMLAMAFKVLT